MTTNVPQPTFGPNGFIIPAQSAILAGVQLDMNAAFLVTFNFGTPTNPTPQGQLSSSYAAIIGNTNSTFLALTQQMDPAFASGRMQDAIGRIFFQTRLPAQSTVLQVTCTGLSGVVIPVGALIADGSQNIYSCTGAGTIPVGGSITLSFANLTPGPIAVPVSVAIYQAITGWNTVALVSGVVGQATESRAAFEARRQASVGGNSNGQISSIRGSVLSVPGVLDAFVTDNATNGSVVIGGQTLIANSLYVAAVGGTDLAVATAIWSHKAPGCAYNGNTTIVVTDNNSGYSPPAPTYSVTFERPPALRILFSVNIVSGPLVPADAATQISNALISAFAGGDGGLRATIGSTILAARFVAPIVALGSWAQIRTIFIASNNIQTATSTSSSIATTVLTVGGSITGTFAVGQTVFGAGIAVGTRIVSLGTGSGGAGTYNLNISQTVGAEAISTSGPGGGSVVVQINQTPTLAAADIAVTVT